MASHASHQPDARTRVLTLEEWAELPEDDEGELVNGHLTEEEVPDFVHELIVVWFTSLPQLDGGYKVEVSEIIVDAG